jgi:hypothetical protein
MVFSTNGSGEIGYLQVENEGYNIALTSCYIKN